MPIRMQRLVEAIPQQGPSQVWRAPSAVPHGKAASRSSGELKRVLSYGHTDNGPIRFNGAPVVDPLDGVAAALADRYRIELAPEAWTELINESRLFNGVPVVDPLDGVAEALANRYRIELTADGLPRLLGQGGMASVYRAEDLKHHRPVAIKIIKPGLSALLGPERFLREISFAAKLNHPHILPLHDSGEAAGRLYYVIPYVESGSLKDRLEHNHRLSIEEALRIAREVASALDYAHQQGIVHRDIKPSNILLSSTHALVADFGIARAIAPDATDSTGTGLVMGTPRYMSPEQSGGGPLDGRSDIYSLACVLYEAMTGTTPFSATTPDGMRGKHYAEEPPLLRTLRPDAPVWLEQALIRALAKSPTDRFPTARQFLAEPAAHPFKARSRAAAVGLGVGLLLLIALMFASPAGRRAVEMLATRPPVAAPSYVAVLSFTSADSADAVLAAGLTQSFTQLLMELARRNPSLWVLSFEDMLDAGVSSPADLRKSYPVSLVVTGEVRSAGGNQSLKTDLFDVRGDDPRLVSSQLLRGASDSLSLASVRALVGGALALPAPSDSSNDSSAVWAASPARLYYLLGVGHMQRAYDLASLTAAIDNFQSAIEQDTSFGAAFAGLCDALWERYMQTGQASTANDATQKCDRAGELSRFDPDGLVALGRTQFFHGNLERAEQTLRSAIQQNAGADAHRWLGFVLEERGKFDEAEREHRQAIALRPDIWIYYEALSTQYMNAERHQEAIQLNRDVIRLSPDNYVGYSNLGASLMLMHRLDEAEKQLKRSIQVRPTALAYRNLGYLGLLRQRYDDAITALREAIRYGPEDWWSWRWLAHAHHWRGDRSAERDAWQRVADLLKSRLGLNPTNQDMLCGMAEASVALGDTEQGLRYLDSLASHTILRVYNLYLTGRVYEMLGRRGAALQYISQALERGFDSQTVADDPWLIALRTDPAYHGPR